MFTWICPQCGREVPPSYNECPDCAGAQKTSGAAQQSAPAAPPAQSAPATPAYTAPPQAPAPPPFASAPAEPRQPMFTVAGTTPSRGMPAWMMGVLSAVGFLVVGAGAFWVIKSFSGTGAAAAPTAAVSMEKPAVAGTGKTHPLQKYVEVVGVRLTEEPNKKAQARFILVNHSGAEISDLAAEVHLSTRSAKPGDEPIGSFSFKGISLGPYESKEVTAIVSTTLRVYELPDWQFLEPQLQITSPQ